MDLRLDLQKMSATQADAIHYETLQQYMQSFRDGDAFATLKAIIDGDTSIKPFNEGENRQLYQLGRLCFDDKDRSAIVKIGDNTHSYKSVGFEAIVCYFGMLDELVQGNRSLFGAPAFAFGVHYKGRFVIVMEDFSDEGRKQVTDLTDSYDLDFSRITEHREDFLDKHSRYVMQIVGGTIGRNLGIGYLSLIRSTGFAVHQDQVVERVCSADFDQLYRHPEIASAFNHSYPGEFPEVFPNFYVS